MVQTAEYAVRLFESGDLQGFFDLYETVFGDERSDEWFDWKYRNNPYVEGVPIQVATDGTGTIVGARPVFALPLSIDGERVLALQPCDTMVHPDHRRQGLFTRMTERVIERYADHEAALFFNFPNRYTRAGNEKLGWDVLGQVPTYYRFQHPSAWLSTDSLVRNAAGVVADAIARGYAGIRTSLTDVPEGITVTRTDRVPADVLASLYAEAVPSGIHTPRDGEFCHWRYENPDWWYRYYVARRDGTPVGAAIVGRRTGRNGPVRLTDVLPVNLQPDPTVALLRAIISDTADHNAILAPSTLPTSVLSAFGFHRDTAFPLSRVSSPTMLAVRPAALDPDAWSPEIRSAATLSNWEITFAEQDTS